MSTTKPKSMQRARSWTTEVEEGEAANTRSTLQIIIPLTAYRFQLAGYRDEMEYLNINKGITVSCYCSIVNSIAKYCFLFSSRWTGGTIITLWRSLSEKMAASTITIRLENALTKISTKSNSTHTRNYNAYITIISPHLLLIMWYYKHQVRSKDFSVNDTWTSPRAPNKELVLLVRKQQTTLSSIGQPPIPSTT